MGSTNRGRLTSAVTDGRATRVVMRLGVAIELVTGLTLLDRRHVRRGEDWSTPVSSTYTPPFTFTGTLKKVTVQTDDTVKTADAFRPLR